jgi:putative endonuclease
MAFLVQNKLGAWGEQRAEQEYLKRGFVLVARNVYNTRGKRLGEIDLVFRTETELIFVEVKTRRAGRFGVAAESINSTKKQKLIRTVHWFRRLFPQYEHLTPRIDVCAIDVTVIGRGLDLDICPVNVIIIPYAV